MDEGGVAWHKLSEAGVGDSEGHLISISNTEDSVPNNTFERGQKTCGSVPSTDWLDYNKRIFFSRPSNCPFV
jgi:hypothetical protein